jgi:hypothetical protein
VSWDSVLVRIILINIIAVVLLSCLLIARQPDERIERLSFFLDQRIQQSPEFDLCPDVVLRPNSRR